MEAELLQLAREAVTALQTGPPPNWTEVAGLLVSAAVGFGQIGLIAWGLRQMGRASEERNRQLDQQGEALRDIGQALRDQGQALRDQGQALRDQSQVLAELLRRTA